MDNSDLKNRFHAAMLNVYESAKSKCNYNATYFIRSVHDNGGLETAKSLLGKDKISDGFTALWQCGCLHISVECLVLHPDFCGLFEPSELDVARKRLEGCEFDCTKCEQRNL